MIILVSLIFSNDKRESQPGASALSFLQAEPSWHHIKWQRLIKGLRASLQNGAGDRDRMEIYTRLVKWFALNAKAGHPSISNNLLGLHSTASSHALHLIWGLMS